MNKMNATELRNWFFSSLQCKKWITVTIPNTNGLKLEQRILANLQVCLFCYYIKSIRYQFSIKLYSFYPQSLDSLVFPCFC